MEISGWIRNIEIKPYHHNEINTSEEKNRTCEIGFLRNMNVFCSNHDLKGLVNDNAHARRLALQNKFVGSALNLKSPLPVQSLKILRFIRTSVALAGLVILR